MESSNHSLKSLDWSKLLNESSEDSCDSDETFLDASDIKSNENCYQHCDQNSNKYEGKIDHQPFVQELLDTISPKQNTEAWPNKEEIPNLSTKNVQCNLQDFKINDGPRTVDSCSISFDFSNTTLSVNNYIKEGNKTNHRFESDFNFTDDMSCSNSNQTFSNNTLQRTDISTTKPTMSPGSINKKPAEFGLDELILKINEDRGCETLDPEFKMCLDSHEISDENILELVTGTNCLPFEEQSTREFQSVIPEDDMESEGLYGLTPNLDDIMKGNYFENFSWCPGIPNKKPCSPPLTLSSGTRRKVLPADKVLPNYRRKNVLAEKKHLPTRKCSSAYIDLSSRKCEGDQVTGTITDTEDTDTFCTAREVEDMKVQPQSRRQNYIKEFEREVSETKSNRQVKRYFSKKVKWSRGRKKKGVFGREKQETETSTESAGQEVEQNKGVDKILQEIKTDVEYIEGRVARWIGGADDNPPTRDLAFKMLADTQSYYSTLQQLKKKHESRRKCIQKFQIKLVKLLLERSYRLEITIDKAIAEADRLMNMELNEISEDFQTMGKDNFDTGVQKGHKYLKPILKNSSSEPSTEEGFSNKRSISFSEEVDCRYLSSSEQSSCLGASQSSSLGPSQSSYQQTSEQSSSSSDNKETNYISPQDDKVCNNIDFEQSYTNMNSTRNHNHNSNPFEAHANPEFEMPSFQNLTINPSTSFNHCKSEVQKCFDRKENSDLENVCSLNPLFVKSRQTKNGFYMRNINDDENKENQTKNLQSSTNSVGTNSVQHECNRNANFREKGFFTPNNLFQQFSFPLSCNPVFDSTKYSQNQSKDPKETNFKFPSNVYISFENPESSIRKSDEKNIQMDKNNRLLLDQTQKGTTVKDCAVQSEASFLCPEASQVQVNSIGKTDNFSENASLKPSENSTQLSENFGFSEQNTQADQTWKNVSIMSIKEVRVPDPSEFMPWSPTDPPDDWADLEDW